MGTIFERTRANGSIGYTAQIIIKKNGKVVHNEAQTFDRRQAASAWMGKRERVLRAPGGLDKLTPQGVTLAAAIDQYVQPFRRLT